MKTLYLDCGMGAAGDMLGAALFSLVDDPEERDSILRTLNVALEGRAVVRVEAGESCGVQGLRLKVDIGGMEECEEKGEPLQHDHAHAHDGACAHGGNGDSDHDHTSITELRALLSALSLSDTVRANAIAVFDELAQAESQVHGCELENVHFHEVGSIDAVADVLCTCLLMERLAPDRVLASPINVGGGTVKCSHGELPVPAPATERLLRGLPYYEGQIKSELCTPTGAALLRHFVTDFGPMPTMCVQRCGYGLGKKEFEQLNALRAFWGEDDGAESGCCPASAGDGIITECLLELSCNLDDMTGEELGFAQEELFAAGALDVWTTPIGMKKGRPGILLSCLGREDDLDTLLSCFFRHTTTLGARIKSCKRISLPRETRTIEGTLAKGAPGEEGASASVKVRIKHAEGCGVVREKVEYEDLAALAREQGLSLREVRKSLGL